MRIYIEGMGAIGFDGWMAFYPAGRGVSDLVNSLAKT